MQADPSKNPYGNLREVPGAQRVATIGCGKDDGSGNCNICNRLLLGLAKFGDAYFVSPALFGQRLCKKGAECRDRNCRLAHP